MGFRRNRMKGKWSLGSIKYIHPGSSAQGCFCRQAWAVRWPNPSEFTGTSRITGLCMFMEEGQAPTLPTAPAQTLLHNTGCFYFGLHHLLPCLNSPESANQLGFLNKKKKKIKTHLFCCHSRTNLNMSLLVIFSNKCHAFMIVLYK